MFIQQTVMSQGLKFVINLTAPWYTKSCMHLQDITVVRHRHKSSRNKSLSRLKRKVRFDSKIKIPVSILPPPPFFFTSCWIWGVKERVSSIQIPGYLSWGTNPICAAWEVQVEGRFCGVDFEFEYSTAFVLFAFNTIYHHIIKKSVELTATVVLHC